MTAGGLGKSPMFIDGALPVVEAYPMAPAAETAYKQYLTSNFGDLSNTRELAQVLFNAGARTAIQASVEFNDLAPRLERYEQRVHALRELFESFR